MYLVSLKHEVINPRLYRQSEGLLYCSVCITNISTLKILPADVKSYKDQKYM